MLILNTLDTYRTPLDAADSAMLGGGAAEPVMRFVRGRDAYSPTPLLSLPGLAGALGLASLRLKDESRRFGLGSFKALGGAYAVACLAVEAASERTNPPLDIADWRSPAVTDAAAQMTVVCATAGNHGCSVAYGAQRVGAKCVVFVPAGANAQRADRIARYGADVVRTPGNYDDAVAEASRAAEASGWIVVSDTSWPGYERIPRLVMQGYTLMLREVITELAAPPTHVFIQAGVGGVAASVSAHFAEVYGATRPFVTVVEPSQAACVFESARATRPVTIPPGRSTMMAMLDCHRPSLVAWGVLSRAADAFMTLEDEDAVAGMRRLARPLCDDPATVAGESGGIGLAALLHVAGDPELRTAIGLDSDSRVLLINTEGAIDPERYRDLVGASPAAVARNTPGRASLDA
ncbi:diaminopropionate ammonia-lyase [Phenylobacterium sp.]|uniref:diaminopropionate ammonia-lyase n=1 Tax=Phenylobacterium sp. TaxID=1871053 RepID=UPI0011FB8C4C|nr:diaminopropionate ammonia-lyase [Phenylobacterium sp.]THD60096.1 MAG: diaminopropionate ammonia-lyase [Phenylobacterium sp.]